MENKTPIQEWIYQEVNNRYPKNAFENEAQQRDYDLKRKGMREGIFAALTYLGLQDIEAPKKWVEDMKSSFYPMAKGIIELQESKAKLQAENKKLKKGLNVVLASIEGSINGVNDFKGDADVVGISEVEAMLNDLFKQIDALKGETT